MPVIHQRVWRVLAWDGQRMQWVIQASRDQRADADDLAKAMQHAAPRRRVRVAPAKKRVLLVKPPVNNTTREFRLAQAARMCELADANKRYKSPG